MSKIYVLDEGQLSRIKYVKNKLYNEMEKLNADTRRDLANILDAVTHSVETFGEITEECSQVTKNESPRRN